MNPPSDIIEVKRKTGNLGSAELDTVGTSVTVELEGSLVGVTVSDGDIDGIEDCVGASLGF